MSGLDLPNGRDSSGDLIENSIPEETAVTVSDTPYQPAQSPLREELPPIPGSGGDLDHEIERLQTELERCKRENIGLQGEAAPGYEDIHPIFAGGKLKAARDRDGDQVDGPNSLTDSPDRSTDKKQQRNAKKGAPDKEKRTCCALFWRVFRFFLVTFLMFAVMLCVIVIITLETEAPIPVIQDIRAWPQVENFKNKHYSPVKESTIYTVKSWFS